MKNLKNIIFSASRECNNLHYLTTTNRTVFARYHKERYACCSFDRWHRGENDSYDKYYGEIGACRVKLHGHHQFRYPNWKLVNKNKKQWMGTRLTKITKSSRWYNYDWIEFMF